MIGRLKQHRTSEEMSESLNYFQELLGDEMYKKLFGLLLIDRGSEFAKTELFEVNTQKQEKLEAIYFIAMHKCQVRNHMWKTIMNLYETLF